MITSLSSSENLGQRSETTPDHEVVTFIQMQYFFLFAILILLWHVEGFSLVQNIASLAHRRSANVRMVLTEKVPQLKAPVTGGMFTNSSPDTKRVLPNDLNGRTRFKIVYVVLESQYQSSLTKACHAINDGKEAIAIEAVGYLLEELRSPHVFEQFKVDVAEANIFIGSLIFVQELADKVTSTLRKRRVEKTKLTY